MNTPYIFFDVANTLLEKKDLYPTMLSVLKSYGYRGTLRDIQKTHRLLSEKTVFPAKTDALFYRTFNTRLFHMLDIQISQTVFNQFSAACRNLRWVAYPDVPCLERIPYNKGIISNWDSTLIEKVRTLLPPLFSPIIGSAFVGVAKPNQKIFQMAFKEANVVPEQCWYIGDSLIQDMEPAQQLGMHTIMIDRYNVHPEYIGERITDLSLLRMP